MLYVLQYVCLWIGQIYSSENKGNVLKTGCYLRNRGTLKILLLALGTLFLMKLTLQK